MLFGAHPILHSLAVHVIGRIAPVAAKIIEMRDKQAGRRWGNSLFAMERRLGSAPCDHVCSHGGGAPKGVDGLGIGTVTMRINCTIVILVSFHVFEILKMCFHLQNT